MSELFETLKLNWEGKPYEIMPTLELIGRVENIITGTELFAFLERGAMPYARLSMAFGLILRSAGCTVSNDAIYQGMFSEREANNAGTDSVAALLAMMCPAQPEPAPGVTKKKRRPRKSVTKA
jgi:hypothetical protein